MKQLWIKTITLLSILSKNIHDFEYNMINYLIFFTFQSFQRIQLVLYLSNFNENIVAHLSVFEYINPYGLVWSFLSK